jgi:hypothetical protein
MNTEQYLNIEFQAQPSAYRDIAEFLAKNSVKEQILNPEKFLFDYNNEMFSNIVVLEKEVNSGVSYFVQTPSGKTGPLQPTRAMSIWAWVNAKDNAPLENNPLVKSCFSQRNTKWNAFDTQKAVSKWMSWLADIDIMIELWKAHRETDDYNMLSQDEKHFVDIIGLLQKNLRKHASESLKGLGKSLQIESVRFEFNAYLDSARLARKLYYPRFQSLLTPVFRFKVKSILCIN